jgi:hypothetical protein
MDMAPSSGRQLKMKVCFLLNSRDITREYSILTNEGDTFISSVGNHLEENELHECGGKIFLRTFDTWHTTR